MSVRTIDLRIALIALLSCFGCSRQSDPAPPPPAAAPASMPSGSASIRGRITFDGTKLADNVITVTDPGCNCKEIIEPGESVSADGGLADAIVYLDLPAMGDGASLSSAVLDQIKCNYSPHVLAVQTRQIINVRSSDPTMHNVRFDSAYNGSRNLSMSNAGETVPVQFPKPEFINFRCDVHPWMSAWVGVFDHPYFCVTDANGNFKISGLAAGDYKMIVWHELLGTRQLQVKVAADSLVEQNMIYSAKGVLK